MNCEYFYYGKRLKAMIKIHNRYSYEVICYTHKKEVVKNKLFFDTRLKETDHAKCLKLYQKATGYAQNYLNTCKY